MILLNPRIYGYYTSAEQQQPEYDPGLCAACPICGNTLNAVDVRTISLMVPEQMYSEGARLFAYGDRSYFYRVHRSCHESLTEAERSRVDGLLIDAIYSTRNTN